MCAYVLLRAPTRGSCHWLETSQGDGNIRHLFDIRDTLAWSACLGTHAFRLRYRMYISSCESTEARIFLLLLLLRRQHSM
ncbi:hypothetical protein P280DRAFT_58211 [Massarina eburnea CBS 473.64]|uniref:Uncharacterized protein n=1 Tax=Massarina eburnea CBS 473.64 TaxID=1395130 RepID=A0A6A6RWA1_9PLEO|nr:hypothetical protein P280DRAFT_58211 [Massarina eburnea CBS 473.64]